MILLGHNLLVPADWLVKFVASSCRCLINSRFLTSQKVSKWRKPSRWCRSVTRIRYLERACRATKTDRRESACRRNQAGRFYIRIVPTIRANARPEIEGPLQTKSRPIFGSKSQLLSYPLWMVSTFLTISLQLWLGHSPRQQACWQKSNSAP